MTAEEITGVLPVTRMAPTLEVPEPVIVIGSPIVILPETESVAVLATEVPVPVPPSAEPLLIATTPAEMVVVPV